MGASMRTVLRPWTTSRQIRAKSGLLVMPQLASGAVVFPGLALYSHPSI